MTEDSGTSSESDNPYRSPQARELPNTERRRIDDRGTRALAVSFLIASILGGSFVFGYWASVGTRVAVIRSAAFILIIAGVHFLGLRLWRRQRLQKVDKKSEARRRFP